MLFLAVGCNIPKVQKNNTIEEDVLGTMVATMTQVEKQDDIQHPIVDEQIILPSFEPTSTSTIFPSKDIIELAAISNADIKNMSDDELISLYSQVVDEMTSRKILNEHFSQGNYIAGRDIRPGVYTLSVSKKYENDYDTHNVEVCYLDEQIENHWLRNQVVYFNEVGEKGSFSIELNQRLDIYGCEVEIVDYRPFLQ